MVVNDKSEEMKYLILVLLLCIQHICKSDGYYYWRDYDKKIPFDAYEAGQDVNKEKVYIGQVYVNGEGVTGIYPTSIIKGKAPLAPIFGAKKVNNFIQILCSTDPDNLEWIPANSTHFHLLKTDNRIIRGGIEDNTWINIGRLNYQGGIGIGKILSGSVGEADMWFVHNEDEVKAQSYEVLTYNLPFESSKINARN